MAGGERAQRIASHGMAHQRVMKTGVFSFSSLFFTVAAVASSYLILFVRHRTVLYTAAAASNR